MATIFSTELDGTNGASVNTSNSGLSAVSGGWTYTTTSPGSGTASAVSTFTAGTGTLGMDRSGTPTVGYHDFLCKVSTFDGGDIMIAQIRNGATNLANIRIGASGELILKNANTTIATTVATLTTNEWFRIQWGVDGTTQTMRLFKSATLADLFNNPATEVISGSYSQGTWTQFRVGVFTSHSLTINYDRLIVDDSTWPVSGGVGNAPPTANAGPDQAVDSGATVNLDGGGSDSDGTIASYAWTQITGPTVTLSSATAEDPSFTAPTVSSSTVLEFQLRVTDDDGTQSGPDTVAITVNPVVPTPSEDFFELFEGGTAGTACTPSNTNFTAVGSGINFVTTTLGDGAQAASGTADATSQVLTYDLPAPTGTYYLDAVFRLSQLTGGPWYLMRVRESATVRATVRVNADGTIQMRNGTTVTGSATSALVTAGQPFRIAWHLDASGTSQEIRVFTGANLWGNTANPGGAVSGTFNTGNIDQFSVGPTLAATGAWFVDSVRADGTDWPASLNPVTDHSNLWVMGENGVFIEVSFAQIQ